MLIVIGGPMFSGKTTWLLSYEKKLPKGTYKLFKPNIDTRYAIDEYVNHDGLRLPAHNISVTNPTFPKIPTNVTTLFLDELNFFDKKIISAIKAQLKAGRTIVAAGLLYDSAKNPFGATLPLAKIADKFIRLTARCDRCGKKASQTYRKIAATEQFLLGAQDTYGASCKRCWSILSLASSK